ncbi:ATP-dependent RNA helicase DDX51-like [Babylonia areolata]|uniref:ATP-dependent RNA helicase DDX51-like n=1 Tax=Babylonia areolata TaxID=304850 RepID=UPI003FD3BE7E
MEKITAEARLEQLKADIARRKLLKLQKQGTPEAGSVRNHTAADVNVEDSSKEEQKVRKQQKQKKPKVKTTKHDINDDNDDSHEDDREKERKVGKKKKKKKLLDKEENTVEKDSDEEGEGIKEQKKPRHKAKKKKSDSSRKAKSDSIDDDDDDDKGKKSSGSESEHEPGDEDDESDGNAEDDRTMETDPNVIGGFTVLGNFTHEPQRPVKRKLPDWLANPTIIGGGLKKRSCDSSKKEEEEDEAVMKILDDDLKENLHGNGIKSFFPVQRQFIPEIWKDLRFSITCGRYGLRPRDFCVSAPTGSGKTLAYTLPIIQCLKHRWEPHVWAVVVLPVRDLAEQVYQVFCQYCAGTPLKVGLVVGKTTFSVEQETLVMKRYPGVYHSLVDILVATPGRLVDHVNSTPGFDLSHLRFLVIDEADRMMEDIKHDWLSVVETAAYTTAPQAYRPMSRSLPGPLTIASARCSQMPLQKLLFSATLSHNPEKLERLNLFMPRLMTSVVSQPPAALRHQHNSQIDDQENEHSEDITENADGGFVGKYTTPEGLTEYLVESESAEKPLVVLHFLHNLKFRSVLCFTNSLETTHRLCLLVRLFGGLTVKEFSSRLPGERRKKILKQFSKGKIDLLVCSDVMARGMDVDNVKYVISYDNPPFIKTYIHRVGRTARAGRAGTAISLLEKKEFFHFKKMMREAGKWQKIREMKLARQALKPLVEPFQVALSKLPQIIKEEKKKHPKH